MSDANPDDPNERFDCLLDRMAHGHPPGGKRPNQPIQHLLRLRGGRLSAGEWKQARAAARGDAQAQAVRGGESAEQASRG